MQNSVSPPHYLTSCPLAHTSANPNRFNDHPVCTPLIWTQQHRCVILIKISNKVFNEFPPMSLMARTLISHIWMMAPSNMLPQHIEKVPTHAGLDKIKSRPVLWLRHSRPQAVPFSKFETYSYDNNPKPFNHSPLGCSLSPCLTNGW